MWTTSLRPISGSGILIDDLAGASLHHEARNAQALDADSGLPAQPLEDCVTPCGAPTDFGAAPAVIWFHSTTDGDSRLQRLHPVLPVGF
jgi:hypothetical protein